MPPRAVPDRVVSGWCPAAQDFRRLPLPPIPSRTTLFPNLDGNCLAKLSCSPSTVGEWLGQVHLQHNDAMNDWHWPPGDSQIHWRGVMAALATVQSQPRLIIEVGSAHLERGKAYLEGSGTAKL